MHRLNFSAAVAMILAAFCSVVSTANAAPINLVSNGSFELNQQTAGTWGVYDGLIGWSAQTLVPYQSAVAAIAPVTTSVTTPAKFSGGNVNAGTMFIAPNGGGNLRYSGNHWQQYTGKKWVNVEAPTLVLTSVGQEYSNSSKTDEFVTYTPEVVTVTSTAGTPAKPEVLASGGVEMRNNVAGSAFDGLNFVELDTYGNSWISQSVKLIKGTTYDLSFAYSGRPGVTAASNEIDVFLNGKLITDGKISADNPSDANVWATKHFTVYGDGVTELKFAAAGNSDSFGGALDKISLSAVPEPASLGLVGIGVAGFMLLRRRKTLQAA